MSATRVSLDIIDVASPCTASWDAMKGDDQMRYCSQCELHVYNLSEMSRDEAETFVANREGRTCVRFFRRTDGTVLTRDCPVGLRAVRLRVARMLAGAAALACSVVFGGVFARGSSQAATSGPPSRFTALINWLLPEQSQAITGKVIYTGPPVGGTSMGNMMMGDICIPPPPVNIPPAVNTPPVETPDAPSE